ncbi:MAG: ATP-dependent Clp protease ATP-binding subunit [Defluviitaleaceae bacterium]|nr:ATP-dependent Clp protease ATP-binding subunit [Defluviitaleaceae bacterium]
MYKFTKKCNEIIEKSKLISKDYSYNHISTWHILISILSISNSLASEQLEEKGLTLEKLQNKIKELIIYEQEAENNISKIWDSNIKINFTPRTKYILEEAATIGNGIISTENLLLSLLQDEECTAVLILQSLNIDRKLILEELNELLTKINQKNNKKSSESIFKKSNVEISKTQNLDTYGKDFTSYAKENRFDPVIGRDFEIKRIIQILSRRTKNNPVLIGEPGVGKTAIVEGLSQKIIEGNVPNILKGKRIISLELSSMIAGSKHRGDFEERMQKIIEELETNEGIILFLDEIHTLIGAGSTSGGSMDAANMLKPALSRGRIQMIGATTIDEYRMHIEKNGALERRFQPVKIEEPTEQEAISILYGLKSKYENHHNLKITDGAIEAAVKFSARYINDRYLPDKAIDLLDESSSNISLRKFTAPTTIKNLEENIETIKELKEYLVSNEAYNIAREIIKRNEELINELEMENKKWKIKNETEDIVVDEEEIAKIVTSWTGIPIKKLEEEEQSRLINLEKLLHERIKGQDEAIKSISKAIRRSRVGIKDPKRAIGSFLFLGSTGVGKTELCKTLANVLFGTDEAILRIDMSEYMERNSINKLIGPPPGYIGYDDGGHFTEKVRLKPYSIVLFDEIEKAHKDIFNLLLQILDDGNITDSHGRKINFKNTVIIMTSNAGMSELKNKKDKSIILEDIKNTFAPEFLNRIDDIIIFNTLTQNEIKQIAIGMIEQVRLRVKATNNINFDISDNALFQISNMGYDEKYGARPLRRTIQNNIEDKIAEELLKGSIGDNSNVLIDFKNNEFFITNFHT